MDKRTEIASFGESDHATDTVFAKFQLITRILPYYVSDNGVKIFTEDQARSIMIGINVFEIEHCLVKKEDL